jgi:ribonuclease HII
MEDQAARERAMWEFEAELRAEGFRRVAGIDEAGRGPLAGPIVAAAVVLTDPVPGLNDSKQLTESKREALFEVLNDGPHAVGVCIIHAEELDRIGLQTANYSAMNRAAQSLDPKPDFVLVDGFKLPHCPFPQRRLVKGDCRSQSIAAASIIAKVTRDRIMYAMDTEYPQYGFAKHKGYGTKAHLAAIEEHGPAPSHRKSFAPIAQHLETGTLF